MSAITLKSHPFQGKKVHKPPTLPFHNYSLLINKIVSINHDCKTSCGLGDPGWFIYQLEVQIWFWFCGCMSSNLNFLFLSFSTLSPSSLWWTDTIVLCKVNKTPVSIKLPPSIGVEIDKPPPPRGGLLEDLRYTVSCQKAKDIVCIVVKRRRKFNIAHSPDLTAWQSIVRFSKRLRLTDRKLRSQVCFSLRKPIRSSPA